MDTLDSKSSWTQSSLDPSLIMVWFSSANEEAVAYREVESISPMSTWKIRSPNSAALPSSKFRWSFNLRKETHRQPQPVCSYL